VITLAGGLAALYIAVNGLYPKSFELVWREEIRLGNGGLKVVETRRTYERLDFLRLNEFQNVRLQSTQLSFEPAVGEPRVSVTTQLQPVYLNQIDGVWYLVLAGRKGDPHGENRKTPKTTGRRQLFNTLGQRLSDTERGAFEPVPPWEKAPRPIGFFNLLSDAYRLTWPRRALPLWRKTTW
jgi:hypothetical protein